MKFSQLLVILAVMILSAAVFIYAVPEGPTGISKEASTSKTANTNLTVTNIAGNVTQLNITGSSKTATWAGFYGNVSGTITLENSNGDRMYSWAVANPSGEVYATLTPSLPQWGYTGQTGSIECWNYTQGSATNDLHYSELEGWGTAENDGEVTANGLTDEVGFRISKNSVDSVNNTFQRTSARSFPSFYVGNQFINGTNNVMGCPSLALYNGTTESTYGGSGNLDPQSNNDLPRQGGNFQEVILYDSTNYFLLFTSIIDFERDTIGFDDKVWDFQMIVPEDGHGTDTSTRTYYFYVELE